MSILKKFEFTTSGTEGTHTATLKGGDVHVQWSDEHWKYLLQTEDNPWTVVSAEDVEHWLGQYDGWIVTKDLSDPELTFPFKFRHNTVSHGIVFTAFDDGDRVCVSWDEGRTSFDKSAAERFVKDGVWIVQKPEQEPSLVFPFTMTEGYEEGDSYKVFKDDVGGTYLKDIHSEWMSRRDLYSEEEMKENIKSGRWVVLSVGEDKPVEASVSNDTTKMTYPIQVDTKDALEAVKELTKAVDELTKAFQRAGEAQYRFKKDGVQCISV